MAIKMIVSDLDGTMVGADYKIPKENIEAVKAAIEKGLIVTIATGRMYSSAVRFAEELGIKEPIITYNGAIVKTVQGELISGTYIGKDTVKKILEYVFDGGYYVQLYNDGEYYYEFLTEPSRKYQMATGIFGHAVGREGLFARTDRVEKLLVVAKSKEEADEVVIDLNIRFSGEIVAIKSTDVYIEVIRPSISKGVAVLALAEKYGILPEEIMALGDSDNDISMLKIAGLAVATGNANETVREIAHHIVARAEDGGVGEAIRRFAL